MIDVLLANGFVEVCPGFRGYGLRGVYVLFNRRGEIVYVGQGNVGCRLRRHNSRRSRTKWTRAAITKTARGESLALEAALIRLLKPKRNIACGSTKRRSDHPVIRALAQPSLFEQVTS